MPQGRGEQMRKRALQSAVLVVGAGLAGTYVLTYALGKAILANRPQNISRV